MSGTTIARRCRIRAAGVSCLGHFCSQRCGAADNGCAEPELPGSGNLGGGSIGLQIGAQSTDFVLLFMNRDGLNSLLKSKFELGGDASVAAGPVGRQAGASTDARFESQILSYSRSKGLFAGLELKGVVITLDQHDMRDVYGDGVSARAVLEENKVNAPPSVRVFPETLARYSNRSAKE
ncbi:MAG: lipid-binding SYLF domain-containing protein [Acidobacteriota bacterium]